MKVSIKFTGSRLRNRMGIFGESVCHDSYDVVLL